MGAPERTNKAVVNTSNTGDQYDFRKFSDLLTNYVHDNITYIVDLECALVGNVEKCVSEFVNAV